MPEQASYEAKKVELLVSAVDHAANTIVFSVDLPSIAQQRQALMSPDMDEAYILEAKRSLGMSEPGVSGQRLLIVDRDTGIPVSAKTDQEGNLVAVLRVQFESFT